MKYITVHSSATQPLMKYDRDWLYRVHVIENGWSDIGYHEIIRPDGSFFTGRPFNRMGSHVKGHNRDNFGIMLIGGVDKDGQTCNNYTTAQMDTLRDRLSFHMAMWRIPEKNVKGHRDWYGDTNKDGVINRYDWLKECPCFDVQQQLQEWKK